MNDHEKDMLAFARTWKPYGGNDDEILPEFGLTATTFYHRVLALLNRPLTHGLGIAECQAIRTFCAAKLRAYDCAVTSRPAQRSVRNI
ncbi:DUF3263 domain-containing protein [Rhodococcus sp. T2V]|uniref:DUF3263 domain-containing protein n=1 Tax=Rhodococcus sp. T2V TaxID=3034164 RepID=UPI0023E189D6|nr:DUF3263 domain-containing protein [Rhodococcus sp. T2V]MDF3310572.1 DUF3263 domain-containing protein [Rhodococcus sp. T2V]